VAIAANTQRGVWSVKAGTYGSFLASRVIQGFGASASEALGPAVVSDVFQLYF